LNEYQHFDSLPANKPYHGVYITTEEWKCCWLWSDGSIRLLTVPAGYIYDGMSVPRLVWTLSGLHPDSGRPGVLPHDVLYRSKGGLLKDKMFGCTLKNHNGNDVTVDRTEADFVLRELMLYADIEPPKLCRRAYHWVRMLGALHWGGPMPCF